MKYELTNERIKNHAYPLRRIRYLDTGELGGWLESEANLSQEGNARVTDEAQVFNNAKVSGNALVSGNASVYNNAQVFDDAIVSGNALVLDNASVFNNAQVYGKTMIRENAKIYGNAHLYDASISGFAEAFGNVKIYDIRGYGHAKIYGNIKMSGDRYFSGHTHINNYFRMFFPEGLLIAFIILVQSVYGRIFNWIDFGLSPIFNRFYQRLLEKKVAGTLPDDIKTFNDDYEKPRSEICADDNVNTDGSDYQRLQVVYLTYGAEFGRGWWSDIEEPWHKVLPIFLKTFFKYPVWLRWEDKWRIAQGLVHTGDTFNDIIPTVQYLWTLGLDFPVYPPDKGYPGEEREIYESKDGPRNVIVKGCKVVLHYELVRHGYRMMPFYCSYTLFDYDTLYK